MFRLKVYRIDISLIGKAFNIFRKTDLPIATASLVSRITSAARDLVVFQNHYIIKDKTELSRFQNPLGDDWVHFNQYYIRHPKKGRDHWLIESEKFFPFIMREQIAEIISFLRSNTSLKYLKIVLNNNLSGNITAGVPLDGIPLEGFANLDIRNENELIINCPEGLKVSERKTDFVWIKDYPELMATIDGFKGGDEFKHTIKKNYSFGLGVKEANVIGVDANWLKEQSFQLTFKT